MSYGCASGRVSYFDSLGAGTRHANSNGAKHGNATAPNRENLDHGSALG